MRGSAPYACIRNRAHGQRSFGQRTRKKRNLRPGRPPVREPPGLGERLSPPSRPIAAPALAPVALAHRSRGRLERRGHWVRVSVDHRRVHLGRETTKIDEKHRRAGELWRGMASSRAQGHSRKKNAVRTTIKHKKLEKFYYFEVYLFIHKAVSSEVAKDGPGRAVLFVCARIIQCYNRNITGQHPFRRRLDDSPSRKKGRRNQWDSRRRTGLACGCAAPVSGSKGDGSIRGSAR